MLKSVNDSRFVGSPFKIGDVFMVPLGSSGDEVEAVIIDIERVFGDAWLYLMQMSDMDGGRKYRIYSEFQLKRMPKLN